MNEYEIKEWGGSINELNELKKLLNDEYRSCLSLEEMVWKHKNNPLGESLISFAVSNAGEYVGARAFWRVYNSATRTFQPCDTITKMSHQRLGIFSSLTKSCLSRVPNGSLIFNFPNNKSAPGYFKLGWEKVFDLDFVLRLSVSTKCQRLSNIELNNFIEEVFEEDLRSYILWRFICKPKNFYEFFRHGKSLIIKRGRQIGVVFNQHEHNYYPLGLTSEYRSKRKSHFKIGPEICIKSKAQMIWRPTKASHLQSCLDRFSVNALRDTF